MSPSTVKLNLKKYLKRDESSIFRLVSFTSLASPYNPPSFPVVLPAPTHLMYAPSSGDLPVLCADDVVVKRQQVRGGSLPPLRCSGTTGGLICTLSQPSL